MGYTPWDRKGNEVFLFLIFENVYLEKKARLWIVILWVVTPRT